MDTFAVSITLGLSAKKLKLIERFIPGIYFGLFQALMPLIGYFAETLFAYKIQKFAHLIAFVLLGFIGGKMIKESFSQNKEEIKKNPFQFINMLLLAIATSIDALLVGVTFAFFENNIFNVILIIGITTFVISMIGVIIGNIFGKTLKSKAEFIGGAALIILGLKILIEH